MGTKKPVKEAVGIWSEENVTVDRLLNLLLEKAGLDPEEQKVWTIICACRVLEQLELAVSNVSTRQYPDGTKVNRYFFMATEELEELMDGCGLSL